MTAPEFEELATALVADAGKMPYIATAQVSDVHRELDEQSRSAVDEVLFRWIAGDDAGQRFDALVLVSDFGISSALPAIERQIVTRAAAVDGPDFFDRQQLEEIAADLRSR